MSKKYTTKKDKYLLSFVEEAIFNPMYQNWAGGRMEIHTYESAYSLDEIRFFTPRSQSWLNFINKYDGKWVDKSTLRNKVINTIEQNFQHELEYT